MTCFSPPTPSLSGSLCHTTSSREDSVSFISLETKLSCFPSLCQMKLAIFTHEQHKKRKQNYRPSRVQILPSKKISDWLLFDFRNCQHFHCTSRFPGVQNVFVLCHFTLIFGIQVPCLNWNSLLNFTLMSLRRYPAHIFFLVMYRKIFGIYIYGSDERKWSCSHYHKKG